MTNYFLSSILWALGGLITGYVVGRAGRVALTGDDMIRAARADNVLGYVVVFLAIVSVVALALTINAQREQVACQTRFNEQFIAALRERTDAATAERLAEREFLLAIVTPGDAEADIRRYIEVLGQSDSQRDSNPLPANPNCDQE